MAHQQPELPEIANEFFEQLVLAHILKADDPEGFSNIRALLSDTCFTKPAHRVIWQSMCTVYDAGSRIGPHLVYLHASKNGHKEITPSFLADLTSGSPIIGDLGPYCTELLDCETLRRLYVANAEVNSRIASRQGTTSEIVRDIERTLANLGRKFRQSNEVRPSAIVERAGGVQDFTTPSTVGSIQFPWPRLQAFTGGLRRKQVFVIGGTPSTGKTTIARNITAHCIFNLGKRVRWALRESANEEILFLMACSRAHVDSRLVRQGQKNDPVGRTAYQDALRQLTEDYDDLLELDNHESATPEGLAAWERRSRSAGRPADLIVVDFLQQVRGVGKFKDKTEEVDSIFRNIDPSQTYKSVRLVTGFS
jgi:replicative DNA helicase